MIPAYPLQWPAGWPRVMVRKAAAFSVGARSYMSGAGQRARPLSVADGLERVLAELKRMSIDRDDVVVSTNVRTRLDGYPRSNEPEPDDPGAAVYWGERDGTRRVMAIDIYHRVADNLGAIAATLDALRAIERHGGAQILERAFTGFTALPERVGRDWQAVLGLEELLQPTRADVEGAYRRLASTAHPDKGGTHQRMTDLNRAREDALREIGA